MFIGHFGVAFAAKKLAPKTSLGTLFIAVQLADLLWPVMLLLGVEHVRIDPHAAAPFNTLIFTDYPVSHSLVLLLIWGALLAVIYNMVRHDKTGAIVLFAAVVSHWVLDVIVHQPDMPILPIGGPHIGLGLWNYTVATIVIETIMFIAGFAVYLRATRPLDRVGQFGPWICAVLLYFIYVSSTFSAPPPNVRILAWMATLLWLFVAFAYWFDRHRVARDALPDAA